MGFLNNLQIKTKLLILLLFPSISITYLSLNIVYGKYYQSQNAYEVKQITTLGTKISNLVHELQKERGFSSGYIASNGNNFKNKLKKQKEITDQKHLEILTYINGLPKGTFNENIKHYFDKAHEKYNKLPAVRKDIISLNTSKDNIISYYSSLNNKLLNLLFASSKLIKKAEIAKDVFAYTNFLYAKEKTGIERAEATAVLAKDRITEPERLKINNLKIAQMLYLDAFLELADKDVKDFYNKTIKGHDIEDVKKIESIILDSAKIGNFNIDASLWFKAITSKIDKLKIVENHIINYINTKSTNQTISLNQELLYFIIIGLLMLIITFSIGVLTAASMNNSLKKITVGIRTILDDSISQYQSIDTNEKNEFGKIANTLNKMVKKLKEKEEYNKKINQELFESNQKALHSAKAKSIFLANMSHEIRTPLNAIVGFIEILKETENDKKKLKYINTIYKSSHSLLGVINDILDFSKIESNKLDINKIDFNPLQEFESVVSLFCAKSEEKRISFNTYIDENLPQTLHSDPLRIKQILSNLLSNAIKFSKQNGLVEVNILLNNENNKVRFIVKDNGIGISKDYQKDLFKPFTQEELSTTRKYGGTGLGLAISSQLVSMLGGELKVKSKEGKGSEFYFELDIADTVHTNLSNAFLIQDRYIKNLKIATMCSQGYSAKKETLKQYLKALGVHHIKDTDIEEVQKSKDFDLLILDSSLFDNNLIKEILSKDIAIIVVKTGLSKSLIADLEGKIKEIECPITISDLHNIFLEFFTDSTTQYIQKNKPMEEIKLNGHILLAEDNKSNQLFMKVVLKKIGLTFDIANDGLEAVEAFKRSFSADTKANKYDAVLMDENMPNLNGIEATKKILEYEKEQNLPHTPIIAITANALSGDRRKFIAAGMDEYLTKPLDKQKLASILENILIKKQNKNNS